MGSSNIRDILTSFSPSSDFFAISSGDGRIKKKRKIGSSLLVLGTGSGDVLALDASAGQLKWRVSDCHPGGVSAISFPTHDSCIYTAGVDGIICKLDSMSGNLLEKFRAATKAISSMSVSSDGKTIATAAAQLKVFNCSDHTKIQKFSGHPGAVRCMIFTDDGKYILSSAVAERYVAVWKLDGGKKQSSCCVLTMDHPAVFLDCRHIDDGDVDASGFYVLAISEIGICYFWYGKNIEELRNTKPTKVSLSLDGQFSKSHKGAVTTIFAAKLQGIAKPASGHIFLAHGLLIKPSFEKILVHSGTDIRLNSSSDGLLLPISQSRKSKKGSNAHNEVSALDRANAEDALLPIPKILDFHDKKKRHQNSSVVPDEVMVDNLVDSQRRAQAKRDDMGDVEDTPTICMEDRLRTLGILGNKDDHTPIDSTKLRGINIEVNLPQKKMRAAILSMVPSDAYKLLEVLLAKWQSRSCSGKYVLPWIYCILVNHSDYIISQEPVTQLLETLNKLTKSKEASIQSLLQLSGRLQLVTAQIDKAAQNEGNSFLHDRQMDESEDDDDDVDEFLYGEEDKESQSSSEDED
ncbi:WD repeat-containing protein 43 isoform X3 [Camellia sinensis]|uniref:WD repeat-containing protein 43 isoform X3 n=1 Tax=Camellia sinensis TaxID=4442 RepID=UPI001036608D|nr:WD repeat-containing protein 43 isoform X3 [Camellia sinensis]XP_028083489.1 WD repeat-containing protein 43 isoform X3 [Camellia sinensis]